MKKRLTSVAPLQLGIVSAILYGVISLLIVPFILLVELLHGGGARVIIFVFLPVIYAVVGFVGGVISAFVYNLVAKWTGGVEFTTEEVQ